MVLSRRFEHCCVLRLEVDHRVLLLFLVGLLCVPAPVDARVPESSAPVPAASCYRTEGPHALTAEACKTAEAGRSPASVPDFAVAVAGVAP